MIPKRTKTQNWFVTGIMFMLTAGFFWGINYYFPVYAAAYEEPPNNETSSLTVEFGCNVWVEEVFAGTREDILISVASYFDNLAPLSGVEGEVTVQFPDGERALFYLPKTNDLGMSSVSVTSARELADIETGRVLISVNLYTFDMSCNSQTSFYVWQ